MGRAIDRLPVDFQEPREEPKRQPRQSDIHNDAHHTLIAQLPDGQREARDEDARRYLGRKGYGDLVDVLGLAVALPVEPKPAAKKAAGRLSVVCPRCDMPAGVQCVTRAGGPTKPHTSRKPEES
jgi:hypothetical protein